MPQTAHLEAHLGVPPRQYPRAKYPTQGWIGPGCWGYPTANENGVYTCRGNYAKKSYDRVA